MSLTASNESLENNFQHIQQVIMLIIVCFQISEFGEHLEEDLIKNLQFELEILIWPFLI